MRFGAGVNTFSQIGFEKTCSEKYNGNIPNDKRKHSTNKFVDKRK